MAEVVSLSEAIREHVQPGSSVALEGFTHLIPSAAGHEIIRQGIVDLTLIRMTPDLIYDQMIGMGCARKLVFSWGGNPGVGSLHRLRDAVENLWPRPLEIDERSHAAMTCSYTAGASGLPFGMLRGFIGSDLAQHNSNIKFINCPYTDDKIATVPAIKHDVAIIHAQKADRRGNVLIWGITGVQKEIALAGRRVIATVEEVVDSLESPPNALLIPGWVVDAVCVVPGGAFPSYAHGYYDRANDFYKQWDAISRSRDEFQEWMKRHVQQTKDFGEFLSVIGQSKLAVRRQPT